MIHVRTCRVVCRGTHRRQNAASVTNARERLLAKLSICDCSTWNNRSNTSARANAPLQSLTTNGFATEVQRTQRTATARGLLRHTTTPHDWQSCLCRWSLPLLVTGRSLRSLYLCGKAVCRLVMECAYPAMPDLSVPGVDSADFHLFSCKMPLTRYSTS